MYNFYKIFLTIIQKVQKCMYIGHFQTIIGPSGQFWLVNKNTFQCNSFFVFPYITQWCREGYWHWPTRSSWALEIDEANLSKAEGKRQVIEANLALRRARTRVEAINVI